MRRASIFGTAVAFILLVLSGCGSEKELPKDITYSTERERVVPQDAPVPTTSQPDAVQFVDRCIRTVTDGHPERLDKLKVNRLSQQGRKLLPSGSAWVPTTRVAAAVWPDRFTFAEEYEDGEPIKIAIGLRQHTIWIRRNGEPAPTGPDSVELLKVDSVGQYWLPTLVPLADPKTVVFGAKPQSLGGQTMDAVQVSVPGCPVYTLWFDEKTNLLAQVSYRHLEGAVPFAKRFSVAGHKPVAGVQVPTRFEYDRNGTVVETWSAATWEFPDRIDDSAFDPPAKK